MITTVVFDLDDTLYDEVDYCRSGFNAVAEYLSGRFEQLNGKDIAEALWKQFSSGNRTRTFNVALDEHKIDYDDEFVGELVEVYRTHKPDISLPEDSRQILSRLSEKYALALLTDGFLPAQRYKVDALGIERYFRCIVYTEELGGDRSGWKPSPIGFEKILQLLDAKAENSVYIADNEQKDFIAPNKLDFNTIQLVRPRGLYKSAGGDSHSSAKYKIRQISKIDGFLKDL